MWPNLLGIYIYSIGAPTTYKPSKNKAIVISLSKPTQFFSIIPENNIICSLSPQRASIPSTKISYYTSTGQLFLERMFDNEHKGNRTEQPWNNRKWTLPTREKHKTLSPYVVLRNRNANEYPKQQKSKGDRNDVLPQHTERSFEEPPSSERHRGSARNTNNIEYAGDDRHVSSTDHRRRAPRPTDEEPESVDYRHPSPHRHVQRLENPRSERKARKGKGRVNVLQTVEEHSDRGDGRSNRSL